MKTKNNIFNTSLIYFIILVLFVAVRICTALDVFSFLGAGESIILTMVIQLGLLLLLPLLLSSKLNKKTTSQTLDDFNFKGTDWRTILISILIGFIVFVLTVAISSFFSFVLSLLGYSVATSTAVSDPTWQGFALSILAIAILPAFCEEFTHRGLLISGFKSLGIKNTIILSSLLFGLLHLNIEQFFYATIIGAILGTVAIFSKSIVPAIIIHFINNFINVYLDFARAKSLPGGDLLAKASSFLSNGNIFLSILFVILFMFLLIILLIYLITTLLKINAQKSLRDYAQQAAIEHMRSEVLGEEPKMISPLTQLFVGKNITKDNIKIRIPYEILGFYLTPQTKLSGMEKVFVSASLFLSGIITLFTFIWGVL